MAQSLIKKSLSILTQYVPGDLIALSDLYDAIQALASSITSNEDVLELKRYLTILDGQLSGGKYEIPDTVFSDMYATLTSLRESLENSEENPEENEEHQHAALNGNAHSAISAHVTEIAVSPPLQKIHFVESDYYDVFAVELRERLSAAEDLILEMEESQDEAACQELFRLFHTTKGEAGFLKIQILLGLYHSLEGLLDSMRHKQLSMDSDVASLMLHGLDLTKTFLSQYESGERDFVDLWEQVRAVTILIDSRLSGKKPEPEPEPNFRVESVHGPQTEVQTPAQSGTEDSPANQDTSTAAIRSDDHLIKVPGQKLTNLYDLVSEMLILQDQIKEDSKVVQQLRKVSREVQQSAMNLNTTMLKPLFVKMRRAVRDLSKQLNKPVNVVLSGELTEIDRTLVEAIEEPLVHLVRNCIGHGIEEPDQRKALGKAPEGTVEITGEIRGNHVILRVRDDGGGLDREKIGNAAIKNGLITPEQAREFSDDRIFSMIFQDGLSTADKLNDISGRGVGMSIVKKTADRFRGNIDIKTSRHQFTEFNLVFPLSSALVDGMLVELCDTKYILPVENVLESVRVKQSDLNKNSNGAHVFQLRHDLLPVFDLGQVFFRRQIESVQQDLVGVVIETNLKQRCMFLVDRLVDKREFVIKTLGKRFAELEGVSAAAILRDGEIGFLVDVDGVVRKI